MNHKPLFNNKKGVQFEHILTGFLILTLFITGGVMMMVDLNTNYADVGVNISTDKYGQVYNTTQDISGIVKDSNTKLFGADVTTINAWDATIGGAYSALRMLTRIPALFFGIATAIQDTIGIPEIITTIAMSVFWLTILFSVVYLIFRFRP